MKNLFSQKTISLISLFCIVFGLMGMAIDSGFSANIFMFGILLLLVLIIWKLWLINKGKEKWGVY